jgi:hypothetical protein
MTQHVSGSFGVLNLEPPIYVDVVRNSSNDPDGLTEENYNPGRMLVKADPVHHDPSEIWYILTEPMKGVVGTMSGLSRKQGRP